VLAGPGARDVVLALAEELKAAGPLDRDAFRAVAQRVRQRTGQKGRALFHPIRVALTGEAGGPELDLAVPAIDVGYDLHRELGRLAPCGPGNPDPLVAILGLTVTRVRAANGGHSQLTLKRRLDVLDGIAFDRPDLAESVAAGDRVDVVGRIVSRKFGGLETLQIEIRDVATTGWHPEAAAILGEPTTTTPLSPAAPVAVSARSLGGAA
jgi:hypothetical protein